MSKVDNNIANRLRSELLLHAKLRHNVLLVGSHGVGKTALALFIADSMGWNMKYFNGPTMDPYLELVGVPDKTTVDGVRYLDFVRPKDLANDEIDMIFIDEINRSPVKAQNAMFELIQFKSVNGVKSNRMKCVWSAINVDDESNKYNVNMLDPAQLDRYHAVIKVPKFLDTQYLGTKSSNSAIFINWYYELSKDQRNKLTPRRLDYLMTTWESMITEGIEHDSRIGIIKNMVNDSTIDLNKLLSKLKPSATPVKVDTSKIHADNIQEFITECIASEDYLDSHIDKVNIEILTSGLINRDDSSLPSYLIAIKSYLLKDKPTFTAINKVNKTVSAKSKKIIPTLLNIANPETLVTCRADIEWIADKVDHHLNMTASVDVDTEIKVMSAIFKHKSADEKRRVASIVKNIYDSMDWIL